MILSDDDLALIQELLIELLGDPGAFLHIMTNLLRKYQSLDLFCH